MTNVIIYKSCKYFYNFFIKFCCFFKKKCIFSVETIVLHAKNCYGKEGELQKPDLKYLLFFG